MASRFWVAALVLSLAAPALAGPTAAEKETARNLMDEGHALRDDKKDPKAALERFRAADQIMHVPVTAYEVAVTQAQLGMLVEARETLARILSTPPTRGEPAPFREARRQAQTLDDSLSTRIPSLVVDVRGPAAGATVTIDGVAMPSSLIGLPTRVNPGHHAIAVATATMHGHAEVDLQEAEKKEIAVELAPTVVAHEEPAVPETPRPVEATHAPRGARTAGLVMIGLGGASLVAGAITGVLTFTTQSDLATKCPNHICGPESHDELATANLLGTLSTVSFVAGGVLAVAGIVTFVVGAPRARPASASAHVEPWIGLGTAGLRGSF